MLSSKKKEKKLVICFVCSNTPPSRSFLLAFALHIHLSIVPKHSIHIVQFVCLCAAFHFSFVNFTLKHKHAITTIIHFSLNRIALIELLILLSVVASLIELVVYSASMLTQCGGIQLAFIPYSLYTSRIDINRSNLKPNRIHRHSDTPDQHIFYTLPHWLSFPFAGISLIGIVYLNSLFSQKLPLSLLLGVKKKNKVDGYNIPLIVMQFIWVFLLYLLITIQSEKKKMKLNS